MVPRLLRAPNFAPRVVRRYSFLLINRVLKMFKKFLAAISISLLALVLISCSGSNEKLLLGSWYSEVTIPLPTGKELTSGEMKLRGVETYLANKSTSFDGQMILVFHYPQGQNPFDKLEITYDLLGASEWEIKDKSIFTKVVDFKFHPASVKINDNLIDSDDQKIAFFLEMEKSFKPEDFIPKGSSSEQRVISIDATTLVTESKDPGMKLVRTTATKTDKSFSEYSKNKS